MYLLGYISRENRLYLGDKELNVISYSLLLPVLEYQTAVMRNDFEAADKILPSIPREQRTRVAHFLEKQGYQSQALAVSTDPEHRFDLALKLKDTKIAYELASEAQSDIKWKQLAKLATSLCEFELAQKCFSNAEDYSALLLLATSSGNVEMIEQLSEMAYKNKIYNIAFLCSFILGNVEKSLEILIETNRLPEAAFFARSYMPSQVSRILKLWKENPKTKSDRSVQALADPLEYENLFPNFKNALKAEQYYNSKKNVMLTKDYPTVANQERNLIQEMLENNDYEFQTPNPAINGDINSVEDQLNSLNIEDGDANDMENSLFD